MSDIVAAKVIKEINDKMNEVRSYGGYWAKELTTVIAKLEALKTEMERIKNINTYDEAQNRSNYMKSSGNSDQAYTKNDNGSLITTQDHQLRQIANLFKFLDTLKRFNNNHFDIVESSPKRINEVRQLSNIQPMISPSTTSDPAPTPNPSDSDIYGGRRSRRRKNKKGLRRRKTQQRKRA
jgi:hypothetical protein